MKTHIHIYNLRAKIDHTCLFVEPDCRNGASLIERVDFEMLIAGAYGAHLFCVCARQPRPHVLYVSEGEKGREKERENVRVLVCCL